MTKEHNANSTYILGTGKHGANHLNLQNEMLKQESFAQLKEAGLVKNMVVWDVGCGSGAMTEYLAESVGPEGLVYAIDISADQVQVTKDRIELAGHKNVQFIVGDIDNIDNGQYKKADIVYSRLVLMHVLDPAHVIKSMASLLKSGGKLSLHEASMNSVIENNTDPSINKYHNLIIEYGELNGFDYNLGRKLPTICEKLNIFSEVQHYTKNYNTTQDIKKLLSIRLDELRDKFISSNLITEEEFVELKIDVNNFLNDPRSDSCIITAEQSHIVATYGI